VRRGPRRSGESHLFGKKLLSFYLKKGRRGKSGVGEERDMCMVVDSADNSPGKRGRSRRGGSSVREGPVKKKRGPFRARKERGVKKEEGFCCQEGRLYRGKSRVFSRDWPGGKSTSTRREVLPGGGRTVYLPRAGKAGDKPGSGFGKRPASS